jgi:FkbM family methyltransferase
MDQFKWIFRAWRYRLKLERQEIRILMNHLQAGDTAIDVGAHKGGYTYWMRQRVGAGGKVIAFEPQPALAGQLADLANAAGWPNITVENCGLSSAPGTLKLTIPGTGTSPGATFEAHDHLGKDARSIPIPVTTLDDYVAAHDHGRISMIKCDAEGHELEVFRGAAGVLAEQRPLLLFECETRHRSGGRVDDVFEFLLGFGYNGWALARTGPVELSGFDPDRDQASSDQPGYINNFLFRATTVPDGV